MGVIFSRSIRIPHDDPIYVPVPPVFGIPGGTGPDQPQLPIPREWIIAPVNATAGQCPSPHATIVTFGVTNAVIAVLAMVIGCRPIVQKLTCGFFGKRGGTAVRWIWIISLACQLLANLLIAGLIKHTPGYEHLPLFNIFALYTARPRVTLLTLALLRVLVGVNLRKISKSEKYDDEVEHVYADSYFTNAIAEIGLEIFAAIFIGITWKNFKNQDSKAYMDTDYKMMEAAPAITFVAVMLFTPMWRRAGEAIPQTYVDANGVQKTTYKNVWNHRVASAFLTIIFLGLVYLIQWSYFDTFLNLPGALWCPPNLASQAGIWISFSTLGLVVGNGA